MALDTDHVGTWRSLAGKTTGASGEPDLVFAHLSDLHGQLRPRPHVYYDGGRARPDFAFDGEDRIVRRAGGVPLLAAKLAEIRSAFDEQLTLMSGDTFHGSAVATYADGRIYCELVDDHLVPDVYVPGNWDFADESDEDGALLAYLETLDATVLANNLYEWETTDGHFEPYAIFDRGDVSVGVVGMTNVYVDRMAPAFHEGKYGFGKHPWLLEEAARDARDDGADVVVAVTEIGLQWAVQAAKDCPSLDVVFSAHTHEYTHDPILVDGTLVVESGMGDALGRVDVRVADDGIEFRHVLYCLAPDHEYAPDPDPDAARAVEAARAPFLADEPSFERGHGTLERPIDAVVGETETTLARRSFLENAWNALFTDALRERFDADLAVTNGYRFGHAVAPGPITLEDLYAAFPMTAPVATGDAYGKQLSNHLERYLIDNFSPHVYEQEDGRVRSLSPNVSATIDPTAKRERRLVELTIDGEPVDPDATYAVATVNHPGTAMRELGGCQFPFRNVSIREGTTPVDVLVDHLADRSPVEIDDGARITTPAEGGDVQNTPADGPYPFVQPGVDYADGDAYCETRTIPDRHSFPREGRNRRR